MHQLLGFFFKYPAYISQQTSSNPAALKSRRRERKKTWGSRRSRRRRFPARFTMFLLTLRIAVRNFAWAHQLCASSINSLRAHRIELGVQTLQSSPYIGGVQSCQTVIDGVFGTTVKKIVCLWPQVCIGIVVYTILYSRYSQYHSTQSNCQTDFDGLKIGACKHTSTTWIVPPMSTFSVNYKWCMTLATSVVRYHRRKIGNR